MNRHSDYRRNPGCSPPIRSDDHNRPNVDTAIILLLLSASIAGCVDPDYGTRLDLDNGQVYYTSRIDRSEALKLGNYLIAAGFFKGAAKSVQLDRDTLTGIYRFRMVVRDGVDTDSATTRMLKSLGFPISREVFNDARVQVELCDDRFTTLVIFPPPDFGRRLSFNRGDLFYRPPITEREARDAGHYLTTIGLFDGKPKSIQLQRSSNGILFRAVVDETKIRDREMREAFGLIAAGLSQTIFNNAPVEVHFCDMNLETISVLRPETSPSHTQ